MLRKVTQFGLAAATAFTFLFQPFGQGVVLAQTPSPVSPTPTVTPLNADVIFTLINQTRASYKLPPFEKDERICTVATSRAPELYNEIFVTHTMHAGFFKRKLPYWATENMISQQTEQAALNWWMNSSVHRSAILGNYKYSCGACHGKSCAQIFTNFTPKSPPPQQTLVKEATQ